MNKLAKRDPNSCPSRHPKPVIGTCAICKKTICNDCKSPITSESGKLICKFCYEDLNEIQKNINNQFEVKVTERIGFVERFYNLIFGEPEKKCEKYRHLDEVIGVCVACRQNVCEKCIVKDKKISTGGYICQKCYTEIYDVQGELEREKRKRLVGGIREFILKCLRITRLIFVLSLILIFSASILYFISLWIFYQLYPKSFENLAFNWKNGKYKQIITKDIPELTVELKERIIFNWKHWGDPHADYDEEKRKIVVREYISIFEKEPPAEATIKDMNSAIEAYKKHMEEQEKVYKKSVD